MHLPAFLALAFSTIYSPLMCDAACEGSVTFYWREQGEDRVTNERNWGLLEPEEKLEDRFYPKLTDFFNPKYVYAYTVEGDCCWKIYNGTYYKDKSATLKSGFHGIPGFPQFNANSMKQNKC